MVTHRKWLDSLSIVPTIKAMNDKMSTIVDMELNKTMNSLAHLSEKDLPICP